MKLILAVLPTILLTAYSQLMIKWRISSLAAGSIQSVGAAERTLHYLLDPFVISAYVFSLLSSIAWFFVVERNPVSIAFPVYVGVLFAVVTVGSTVLLKENISVQHLAGLLLIFLGVIVVSRAA